MKITLNVKLAIIAGILNCIAWFCFFKASGPYSWDVDLYRYLTTLGLLFTGIFISVYFERKNNGNILEFKDAWKCGLLYSLVLALILSAFNSLYYNVITPDTIDFFVADAKKQMQTDKVDEKDILRTSEYIRSYFGSFRIFGTTLFQGIIISLLAAAVLRKKAQTMPFSEN